MDMNLNQTYNRQRAQRRPRQPDPNSSVTVERFSRRVRTRYANDAHGITRTTYGYHYRIQGSYGGSNTYLAGHHYAQQQVFSSGSSQGGNLTRASTPGPGLPFPQGIYALGGGSSQITSIPAPLPFYQQTGASSDSGIPLAQNQNSGIPLAQNQNFQLQQQPQNQHAFSILHRQHSNIANSSNDRSRMILRRLWLQFLRRALWRIYQSRASQINQSQDGVLSMEQPFGQQDFNFNIDSLTYENAFGNVNAGLSEEDITRLLMTRTYLSSSDNRQNSDICVICQAEYEDEETIGTLHCGHEFHANCIREWLRLKNTCPICKSTALPTSRAT
ncbi:Zinc finger, RING-type [Dillenia turbinata]|uniref:RING-type E3 ubiquitin transferase n=1 Tax=Dillenia turbinata TaxID=194707 RepID=A0AAN8UUX1_9MAGN